MKKVFEQAGVSCCTEKTNDCWQGYCFGKWRSLIANLFYSVSCLDAVHLGAGFDWYIFHPARISAKPAPTICIPHHYENCHNCDRSLVNSR
ncbi:hypothetical protein ACE1B6_11195 [Aerosakkonemataceae cyanobacterium BLCC-F154]|uniref:Uncharacterized protein n=1 Tax=Floridaenema fluviatile BLCC-F154 TaxID=3153640 RepID=A0ABV4YAT2_9CYAN